MSSETDTPMSSLRSSAMGLAWHLAPILRACLSPQRIKALLTRSSADLGRERYRRAVMTASTSYIAKALTILTGFVSVPLTINYLGAESYGVWLTISSLLFWVGLTDFGLAGNALVNVISEAVGNDDRGSARQYTASAFWAVATIAVILGLVLIVTFHSIPWRTIFRASNAISTDELELTCALVLALFLIGLPLSLLRSLYNAHQDGYLSNLWGIASGVVSLLGLIIVTRSHGGLVQLVCATWVAPIFVSLANASYAFVRRYPWLAPTPAAVRWVCLRRLVKLGGKYMIMQLASLGIYQSQPMIITQLLGPSRVVIFMVTYKVITLPMDLVYMGTLPFMSAFGEAKARRDWSWVRGAYRNTTFASAAIGLPLAAALALVSKPLILIWAGASAVPDPDLVFWLFIYAASGICLMTAGQLLCGIERLEPLLLSIILCAVGSVVFGVLLAPVWGLGGLALAMAVSQICAFWPIQVYEVRRIFRAPAASAAPRPAG